MSSVLVTEVTPEMLFEVDEPLTGEQFEGLVRTVRGGERERLRFAERFVDAAKSKASGLSRNPVKSLKVGQGFYALGEYEEAVKWLEWAGESAEALWLKAQSLCELGRWSEAIEAYEAAGTKGADNFDVAMAQVECLRRQGELEEAASRLKKAARVVEIRAEYHYQLGCLHDAQGERAEALAEWDEAVKLDGNHAGALFALAYGSDLYGDEEKAVEYYERCLETGRRYVTALLNLAVLYEDAERYEEARRCVRRVLAAYPNHARAKLFLKDIESSLTMYYDEDQERRVDRRNAVLQIPISDFELSVRSRNCLKKMNIRYVGDLLRVTEQELLAYKNFGETSLQEIKAILGQRGLRLGQMLEDRSGRAGIERTAEEKANDELLGMSVADLELSVRARKALQRLNLNSLAELVQCTEAELLGCKNFGQTSLQEVKQRLKDKGLGLRKLEE